MRRRVNSNLKSDQIFHIQSYEGRRGSFKGYFHRVIRRGGGRFSDNRGDRVTLDSLNQFLYRLMSGRRSRCIGLTLDLRLSTAQVQFSSKLNVEPKQIFPVWMDHQLHGLPAWSFRLSPDEDGSIGRLVSRTFCCPVVIPQLILVAIATKDS